MSGGVDSSVAAHLLQQAGFACTGATMKLYTNEAAGISGEYVHDGQVLHAESGCCSLADVECARGVAARLGMPFYVFNFTEDFTREVIERFVAAYERGQTPNPCIDCNRYLKFERFMARAAELDFAVMATGHYARVDFDKARGRWTLRKALDATKDQSYVLYTLTQEQLARLRLPLGGLRKTEVRALATHVGFSNADKPESQDICFVPDHDYARFIEHYSGGAYPEGDFLDADGAVIGRHRGLIHYTLGQRKGLGAFGRPMYVTAIDAVANTVTLGDAVVAARTFEVGDLNWIAWDATPTSPFRAQVKIGYKHPERPALVEPAGDGQSVRVTFDEPQRAITPGQAAVFYDGEFVLGGGTISA
jgi:tRNA-specific 2-thiouridylase